MEIAFTKMSKKGQVVIPKNIRERVNFKPTDKFIVYDVKGSVVIKKIEKKNLIKEAEKIFSMIDSKKLKLKPEDIEEEISAVRK